MEQNRSVSDGKCCFSTTIGLAWVSYVSAWPALLTCKAPAYKLPGVALSRSATPVVVLLRYLPWPRAQGSVLI